MAQLGVSAGGAVVGAALGSLVGMPMLGAQIGWAAGSLAGALLFNKQKDQQGPRLNERTVTTSAYGNPIPLVAGATLLAGEVIWADEIRETKKRRRQGKGGQPRVTEYSYSLSFAVGLCEWLIDPTDPKVLRLWLDDKLVWDATGASEVTQVPGLTWRFYPGSASQYPDPLIEAKVGTDDAPAFRDLCYIVFEDLPLDPFGRRMPNVRAEVASTTTATFPQVAAVAPSSPIYASGPSSNTYLSVWACNVAIDYRRGRIYEGRTRSSGGTGIANDELIRVYDLVTMETLAEYMLGDIVAPVFPDGVTPATDSCGAAIMHLATDGFLYVTGGTGNRGPLFKIDPDAWQAVGVFGDPEGDGFGIGPDNGTYLCNAMQIQSVEINRPGGASRHLIVVQGSYSSALTIDAEDMTHVWGANDVTTSPAVVAINLGLSPVSYPVLLIPGERRTSQSDLWVIYSRASSSPLRLEVSKITYSVEARDEGGGVASGISVTSFGNILVAGIDASATYAIIQSGWYNEADGTLFLTIAGDGAPASTWDRFTTFNWNPTTGAVVWSVVDHALPPYHDARGAMSRVLSGVWGLGGNFVVTTADGTVLTNASGTDFKSLYWYDEGQAVIGYTASGAGVTGIAKRYLRRSTSTSPTVGDIVAALCERAGMETADYDTTDLVDGVRGYLLPRPMSARDAVEALASAYQFDAVEVDDVLVFVKRGGTVAATIAYADMVREQSDENILDEQRAQDADLPRAITVRFPDFFRQYEQGAQTYARPAAPTAVMASRGVATLDLPVPMSVDEAKTIARRMTIAVWRERTRLAFSVGPYHARLVPTDPITVTTRDGASIRCRVLSVEDGANWVRRIEAVTEDAAVYSLDATGDGGSGWIEPTIPLPYFTRLLVPDLALIDDGEDLDQNGLREYAFALSYSGSTWAGVRVYRSTDVSTWSELGTVVDEIPWGTVTAVPDAPRSPWSWDEAGELTVRMAAGEPESATDLEVLGWVNLGALIGSDGQAELIQWRTATDNGDGTFTMTGLLRGRRGTEDLIPSRAIGDIFLILDDARIAYTAGTTEATATRYHRAVGVFDTVETAPATATKSARGRAEKPYSVVNLASSRDGSNNLTITWSRRTRVGGEWRDATGAVDLSEASEEYEVDVITGLPARYAPTYDASSTFDPAFVPSNAFDGNPSSEPYVSGVFTSAGEWLRITYAYPIRITRYEVQARNDGFLDQTPKDWTFQGWDGVGWIVLDTQTGQTGWSLAEIRGFNLAAPDSYTQYRLLMTDANGSTIFSVESLILRVGSTSPPFERVQDTVLRTITATSETASYSAANQTTDFGGTKSGVFVRVYQISNIVGRGVVAEYLA